MKQFKNSQVLARRCVLIFKMCFILSMSKSPRGSVFLFLFLLSVLCQWKKGVGFFEKKVVRSGYQGVRKGVPVFVMRRKGKRGSMFCYTLFFLWHNSKKFLVC